VAGSCEHNNDHFGSIRNESFLDHLSDYYLLKDSVPWSYFLAYNLSGTPDDVRNFMFKFQF
jgi:hypothetical protein